MQYSDDTLIATPADKEQLLHLQSMLHNFAQSTGHLELPLGTTRPTIQEYMTMTNRIERRIMGRLISVNSVLSALPTFYHCTFKFLVPMVDQVGKYRMHFLWDNREVNRKGGCLVAWKKACLA